MLKKLRTKRLYSAISNDLAKAKQLAAGELDFAQRFEETGWSILTAAVCCGDAELVGMLLAAGAPVNEPDLGHRIALCVAIDTRNTKDQHKIVDCLIKANADVNVTTKNGTPVLAIAIHKGDLGVVQSLVEAGAAVNAYAHDPWVLSPLKTSALYGHPFIASYLISKGAEVTAASLKMAAVHNQANIVKIFMSAGVPGLNDLDDGRTLLMSAAARKNDSAFGVLSALIEGGADVNVRTEEGETALDRALAAKNQKCISALVAAGAAVGGLEFRREGDTAVSRQRLFRGGEMTLCDIFDFQARKVITTIKDAEKMAVETKEFSKIDNWDEIERAYQALLAQDGTPTEWRKIKVNLDFKIGEIKNGL